MLRQAAFTHQHNADMTHIVQRCVWMSNLFAQTRLSYVSSKRGDRKRFDAVTTTSSADRGEAMNSQRTTSASTLSCWDADKTQKEICMSRKQKTVCLPLALVIVFASCTAKVVVTRVKPLKPSEPAPKLDGIIYALPRTVVKAEVPIVRIDKFAGEFALYAPIFFPREDFAAEDETSFRIERPGLDVRAEADPEQIFMVKIKGNYLENKTLMMNLDSEGVLAKATAENTNESLDFALGAAKTFTSIFVPALTSSRLPSKLFATTPSQPPPPLPPAECPQKDNPREMACYNKLRSAEEKEFFCRLADVKVKAYFCGLLQKERDEFRKKYRKSDYDDANRRYEEISSLSDLRMKMIQGETTKPLPAETLKVMLQEIDSLIAQQKKIYFLGDVNKRSWTGLFEMTPTDGKLDDKKDLFKFARESGVCELLVKDQGVKIPPAFQSDKKCEADDSACQERLEACKSAATIVLRVEPMEKENILAGRVERVFPKNPEPDGEDLGQRGDRGFYYRIPAKATVRIINLSTDNKETAEHARKTLQIAQLGWVVSLPASTGGRKTKYDLALNPLTGALANFNLGTDPLIQKAMLEDIKGIATPITDAKDELKQLQRAREILEERQKVRVAADALQRPLPTPTPATNN